MHGFESLLHLCMVLRGCASHRFIAFMHGFERLHHTCLMHGFERVTAYMFNAFMHGFEEFIAFMHGFERLCITHV